MPDLEPSTSDPAPDLTATPIGLTHVPLGVPLGMRWGDANGGDQAPVRIRLGPTVVDLPAPLYDAWVLLRASGVTPTVERPSPVKLRRLEELGLLLRCRQDAERALRQLDPLVPTSSAIGAGNSAARPEVFVIISQEQRPLALLDAPTYAVWARAGGGATVASACAAAAAEIGDLDRVRQAFVRSLPALLACAVLFLEPPTGHVD